MLQIPQLLVEPFSCRAQSNLIEQLGLTSLIIEQKSNPKICESLIVFSELLEPNGT